MSDRKRRGNIILEFSLVVPFFLLPMFLFTYAIGFNLLMQLQVVQFCRDAGHLYVTLHYQQKADINSLQFQGILSDLGASAGYSANAKVIFAQITYVDGPTCVLGGGTSTGGGCANYTKWVFSQYYTQGTAPAAFTSFLMGGGQPVGTGTGTCGSYAGCKAKTGDDQGNFSASDVATQTGLQVGANFASMGITAYNQTGGGNLPTGQTVYYVEVGSTPFNVPGITSIPALNDHAVF